MARNDFKGFPVHPVDRAPPRAGFDVFADASPAESWRALANVTVASTLVVAVAVSVFALVEAVVSAPPSLLARTAPHPVGSQSWHARAQPQDPFLPTPVQAEPALFVTD